MVNIAGMIFAVIVMAVAAVLAYRQWGARRRRETAGLPPDAEHFRAQDRRRWSVCLLMALAAAGIATGATINPREGIERSRWFALVWLIVLGLAFAMVALAVIDWFATAAYARRQVKLIREERQALMVEVRDRLRRMSQSGEGES